MERVLIRELTIELAHQMLAELTEGGVRSEAVGSPLDDENSALGRACQYFGIKMLRVPSWNETDEDTWLKELEA